jgi:hypothetical protein
MLCTDCKLEMRLFGIEAESAVRDPYTFECQNCGRVEARGVLVSAPYSPKLKHSKIFKLRHYRRRLSAAAW